MMGATGLGLGPILQNLATWAVPEVAHLTGSLAASAFNLGIADGAAAGGFVVSAAGAGPLIWVGVRVVAAAALLATASLVRSHWWPDVIKAREPAEPLPGQVTKKRPFESALSGHCDTEPGSGACPGPVPKSAARPRSNAVRQQPIVFHKERRFL
ncbi:hypothetical protein QF026_000198 [Streptomyces aurantiacus]|uniref:hypothetical protein n=1 Tax=Streptomyces aurantiacus TaxID=47760 RepID=UPI00278D37AB|nr:hypothetical protein [Streptomyces aurantiacus]MDQ0771732.1 hypothetical protein [Streptomyces aurantiacus]